MTTILSDPSYFLPPLLAGGITLILLVIALVWSRRDFTTWLFCGFLTSMALSNFLVFFMRMSSGVDQALLWERVAVIPAAAAFVFYYHFTRVYTNMRGQKYAIRAAYLFLITIVALAPTNLIIQEMQVIEYGYAPIVGPVSYIAFAAGPLMVLGGAYNLIRYYKVSTLPEERRRLIILAIAVVLPIIGMLWDGFTTLPPLSVWSNLLFTILCTIAIVKYNLLDIRIIVRKSLVYLLVSVVAAVPYVSVLIIINVVLKPEQGTWWIHAIMLLLLAIVLRPLYGWAQKWVDRFFYRGRYDHLRALEQFSRKTQSIENSGEVGSTLVNLISSALRSSTVCLLVLDKDTDSFIVESLVGTDKLPSKVVLSSRSPLIELLKVRGGILSSHEFDVIPELQSLSHTEKKELNILQAELYIPIQTRQNQLSAVLILGKKSSQQSYLKEDIQLLSSLASQTAVHLENAMLYEKTRESEEKLRLMYESIADGIIITDLIGNITQINEAAVHMYGYNEKEELIGQSLFEILAGEDESVTTKNLRSILNIEHVNNIECTFRRRDGSKLPAELSAAVFRDSSLNAVGVVAVVKEITERKSMQEREKQMLQELNFSRRLTSIGELAAGVAHEINNPLTTILGFSERLLRKIPDKTAKDYLEAIHSEARRASRVIENLRTFARRRETKKERIAINDVLQSSLEMRIYELKTENIEVNTEFISDLPLVMADFHQIQQVFLNIILNAEQAITESKHSGRIVIKTSEYNGHVRTVFTDDGPGIPDGIIDRVFDPFFTTRADRGGTGLGLSICHGIITEHGGKIYARSQRGEYTTFYVELPNVSKVGDKVKFQGNNKLID